EAPMAIDATIERLATLLVVALAVSTALGLFQYSGFVLRIFLRSASDGAELVEKLLRVVVSFAYLAGSAVFAAWAARAARLLGRPQAGAVVGLLVGAIALRGVYVIAFTIVGRGLYALGWSLFALVLSLATIG